MNGDLIWVLAVLAGCVALFIWNRFRMDVVALVALTLLALSGVLTSQEVLSGFSDPNVILIALLFVIGEGLVRTGVTTRLGDWLVRHSGKSETKLRVMLMLTVAGMGAFMSSTGIVAVFIPVVLGVCRRMKISPRRMMMPLCFAGLISGMMSLVATAPNMVADSALKKAGLPGLGFFSMTPVGLAVLVVAIFYMGFVRRWLAPDGEVLPAIGSWGGRGMRQMILEYGMEHRGLLLEVRDRSLLIGQLVKDLRFREKYQSNLIAIEREGVFGRVVLHPGPFMEIQAGDKMLLDVPDRKTIGRVMEEDFRLHVLELRGGYFLGHSREVGMAEVTIPVASDLIGKSVIKTELRRKFGVTVVGMRRGGKTIQEGYLEEPLRIGDVLLVVGTWKAIRALQGQRRNFLVFGLPVEYEEVAPDMDKAPYALASLAVMVVLMVSGLVPNVFAALLACLMMGAFGCLTMPVAYQSIHWQSLILIVGMMPFSVALEKTGGIAMAVSGMMNVFQGGTEMAMMAGLFGLTAVIGLFISNTATAVLMCPVAVKLSTELGVSATPFVLVVALAASAAFMTPVSTPVNALVMGPGNYRFSDYVKVGVPFTILVGGVTVTLLSLLY